MALIIDTASPDPVLLDGRPIPTKPTSLRLLIALARRPGAVLSWSDCYEAMYPAGEIVEPQQVYWHTHQLRKNLPGIIITVPRRGLCLRLPPSAVHVQEPA